MGAHWPLIVSLPLPQSTADEQIIFCTSLVCARTSEISSERPENSGLWDGKQEIVTDRHLSRSFLDKFVLRYY